MPIFDIYEIMKFADSHVMSKLRKFRILPYSEIVVRSQNL